MDVPLFPPQASEFARSVDAVLFVWLGLAGVVLAVVGFLIVFFAIKYRRGSKAMRTLPVHGRRTLEIAWMVAPLLIFLVMSVWAATLYYRGAAPPADALVVYVVGKQWMWKLQHAQGRREIDELHVPAGRAVKLVMTSQDVIHDFFLPDFRVKRDVLPGRYTSLWFAAATPGEHRLFCSQYCGTDHARMIGRLVVMEPAAFQRWLAAGSAESMAARGAALFRSHGCSGCHGANASVHAPHLEGLFGRPVQLADGSSVIADEGYIHDSVLLPEKQVVAGYAPIMPSFQGQIGEEELVAIVEYIKSLGDDRPGAAR